MLLCIPKEQIARVYFEQECDKSRVPRKCQTTATCLKKTKKHANEEKNYSRGC